MTKHNPRLESFVVAPWRIGVVGVALLIALVVMVVHLAKLQVIPSADRGYAFLQDQGNARTNRVETLTANRGIISDRNGQPLAVSTPLVTLWMDPRLWRGDVNDARLLAAALDLDMDEFASRLTRYADKSFMYIKRNVTPTKAQEVLSLKLPGVAGKTEYQRFYPAADVAAHIVGFTDIDDIGREGLELAYEQWLQAESGSKRVIKDRRGQVIREEAMLKAPKPGQDLQLSIDLRLQYIAHRELQRVMIEHRAKAASLVMIDVQSGEILAMANQPSYNPNERSQVLSGAMRNRALTDQFEPGSTMKPLTVIAALESGRYTPQTQINTHPGWIHISRKTLVDPVDYGVIDVTKILTKSSQVGITKIALDLEPEQIYSVYHRLGLGRGTATGFPGERLGVLPFKRKWSKIERANFAFGYGMTVTAVQLAQAYAVIANFGVKQDVTLLKREQPALGERVLSEKICRQVIDMLKTVVKPGGTATQANLEAWAVAGKTGTAHKVTASGYADDRYVSIFAGMAPAEKPRIVTVVMVDEPQSGKYYGGEVAAPVFARVMDASLRLLNVRPSSGATTLAEEKNASGVPST